MDETTCCFPGFGELGKALKTKKWFINIIGRKNMVLAIRGTGFES